jgi:alkylated DNA repair dioxygenase AlkB
MTMRLRPSALDHAGGVERPTGPRDLRLPSLDGVTAEIAIDTDAPTERIRLDDESWDDVTRGWLLGADDLSRTLVDTVPWTQGRVFKYERYVDEPRVGSWYDRDTPYPHPALTAAHRKLQHRYRVTFGGVGLAWYRDGNDSVAFHRDTDLRYCENTVIAILSLGAQRPWLVQPRGSADRFRDDYGGKAVDLSPAGGDLLVMGGRAQTNWLHAVPKVPGAARDKGRISAQWRWTSKTGMPERDTNSRAPRRYSRSR